MPDSVDFDPELSRWAITTGLVKSNTADPPGGAKDVGWAEGAEHVSTSENNKEANTYTMLRWLDEDYAPGASPWGGLLGSEAAGAGLVVDSATNFSIDIAAGRWMFKGLTFTLAADTVSYGSSSVIGVRHDYVVVDVDEVARTAAYAVVRGTVDGVLPALASDQIAIATMEIANGPGGSSPSVIRDIRFQAGPPRPPSKTIRLSLGSFNPIPPTSGNFVFDTDEGSVRMDDSASAQVIVPLDLPVGATITGFRMYGLKNAPSLASDGNTGILRRRQLGGLSAVPAPESIAFVGSDTLGLSATPFEAVGVFENAGLPGEEPIVHQGFAYEVQLTHVNSASAVADRPRVWGFEVDVTY